MSTTPVVRLANVAKSYQSSTGRSVVLEDVDLVIERGDKVSVMGPSGSGKSTLLSLIAGLLRPNAGTVEFDGRAFGALDDRARAEIRANGIGIALQSENLIPFLSAHENVALACRFADRRRPRPGRVDALLEQMGVAHRRHHLPRQLSGGEAQRVALAVALANGPALLLADEMVAQLDEATAAPVVDAVFSSDMAVLYVTHDAALAARAERRLRLHERKVTA